MLVLKPFFRHQLVQPFETFITTWHRLARTYVDKAFILATAARKYLQKALHKAARIEIRVALHLTHKERKKN